MTKTFIWVGTEGRGDDGTTEYLKGGHREWKDHPACKVNASMPRVITAAIELLCKYEEDLEPFDEYIIREWLVLRLGHLSAFCFNQGIDPVFIKITNEDGEENYIEYSHMYPSDFISDLEDRIEVMRNRLEKRLKFETFYYAIDKTFVLFENLTNAIRDLETDYVTWFRTVPTASTSDEAKIWLAVLNRLSKYTYALTGYYLDKWNVEKKYWDWNTQDLNTVYNPPPIDL